MFKKNKKQTETLKEPKGGQEKVEWKSDGCRNTDCNGEKI